jgi:DNA-binding MarR family transcriptional regulator
MADINSRQPDNAAGSPGRNHASPPVKSRGPAADARDGDTDSLLLTVELLFFAYRDFTGEADAVLSQFGFGRAHHRVLHFVNRRPGIRVADLLDILRITKQSLARVLKQLLDRGFIAQEAGDVDRRERHLFLTSRGQRLADELRQLQTTRIRCALASAGPAGDVAVRAFLLAMVAEGHRADIEELIGPVGELSPGPEDPPSLGHDREQGY